MNCAGWLVALAIVLSPLKALAVPAFARTYQVPCSTCHTTITRRSEFGDAFRKSGYHWPGGADTDAIARKPSPIEMAGTSAWVGLLPAIAPISALATLSGQASTAAPKRDAMVFGTPSLSLHVATPLGSHGAVFSSWSGRGAPNELVVAISRIADRPEFNVRLGRLEPTTTLFRRNEALLGTYFINSATISGDSIGQGKNGLELTGILGGRTFYAVGMVQSSDVAPRFGTYYQLSHKFWGMSFAGEEPELDLEESHFTDDLTVTLGHWGYLGTAHDGEGTTTARIRRLGFDAQMRFKDLTFWSGVMWGADRDRLRQADNPSLTTFAEVTYAVKSWLVPVYVYQYLDSADRKRQVQEHSVGVIGLALENVRGRLRYVFSDDAIDNEQVELQVLVGL